MTETVTGPPGYIEQLGAFVEAFDLDQCPAEVVDSAKRILLDTVGVLVAGTAAAEVRRLQESLGIVVDSRGALASTAGSPLGFTPASAAFIHGTAGTWYELDEGNYVTNQHPAIHVVPAALAVAEANGMSGRDLLAAVVVGYEVSARAGMATTFRDDVMHPHGTHGILGGSAAVARLHQMDAEAAGEAVRIASSMSVATSRGTVFEGATVRNTYAGQAGQNAVLSGELTRAGFRGQSSGPAAVFGQVSGTAFDENCFVEGLGSDFLLCRNYFKVYSCCAYNHAALNALEAAVARRTFAASEIESVDVETYFPATRMASTDVANPLAAKFSLPYSVAAMLLHGHCWQDAFEQPILLSGDIREVMERVRIIESEDATRAFPQSQHAAVRVTLRDGTELRSAVDSVHGDWREPLPKFELTKKFLRLVTPVLGYPGAQDLGRALLAPEPLAAQAIGGMIRGEWP